MPKLSAEFRAFVLLTGQQDIIHAEIESFKRNSLPYLPAINLETGSNSIYSTEFLSKFHEYDTAKIAFEEEMRVQPTLHTNSLNKHGLFAVPDTSTETNLASTSLAV